MNNNTSVNLTVLDHSPDETPDNNHVNNTSGLDFNKLISIGRTTENAIITLVSNWRRYNKTKHTCLEDFTSEGCEGCGEFIRIRREWGRESESARKQIIALKNLGVFPKELNYAIDCVEPPSSAG